MYVFFVGVGCTPDGEFSNEVWEHLAVVKLFHYAGWEQFVGISKALDGWLEFFDDVEDCLVVFEVFVDGDSE